MNILKVLTLFLTVVITGCASSYVPSFNGEPVAVNPSELDDYWVPKSIKHKMLGGRPDWLPTGEGKAVYAVVIDSNGYEVSKQLISSIPEGWMTQKRLDKKPSDKYYPAPSNSSKLPVKSLVTIEARRRG